MTYCFKCRTELPDEGMIYCPGCSMWADDETEQETVIRHCEAAPVTFVFEAPRRPARKVWLFAGVAAGLLLLAGLFVFMREISVPRPATIAEAWSAVGEQTDRAEARGGEAEAAEPAPAPTPRLPDTTAAVTLSKKERPASTLTTATVIKRQPMRTRIEIVDGVERCYALPGGREVPC